MKAAPLTEQEKAEELYFTAALRYCEALTEEEQVRYRTLACERAVGLPLARVKALTRLAQERHDQDLLDQRLPAPVLAAIEKGSR